MVQEFFQNLSNLYKLFCQQIPWIHHVVNAMPCDGIYNARNLVFQEIYIPILAAI